MAEQYLETCRLILERGQRKKDRTGVGTISYFGAKMEFDLNEGFPLLTTKKISFRLIVHELLWFIKGNTNIKYLVDHQVNIWNEWPFEKYKKSDDYRGESLAEFIDKIKRNQDFARKYGDLGPIYGKQWRNFNGVDQLVDLIKNLKSNPFSRRHILTAWNPAELDQMALPPCHLLCQFEVSPDYRLSCLLYQRSGDMFLGVPFNIASYGLLTIMIAQVCGYRLGKFVHVIGDAHLYLNHLEQIQTQLTRSPKTFPQVELNPQITSLFDFTVQDIVLRNYHSWPAIKAKVAV